MFDLYLIRHGESQANKKESVIGGRVSWSPLSLKGQAQAMALNSYFRDNNIRFNRIVSSTALRAIQTAMIGAAHCFDAHTLEVDKSLEELHQGDWEGKDRYKIYTPDQLKIIKQDPYNFKAPNGESQKEVAERVDAVITYLMLESKFASDFLDASSESPVAVFCHGFVIKTWLYHLMQFNHDFVYPMTIDNCSITRLTHTSDIKARNGTWSLKYINFVPEAVGKIS